VPRQKPRNGTWAFQWLFSCKQLPAPSKSDFMGYQINFGSFTSKHEAFYWRYKSCCNSNFSYLCSCTSPLATLARTRTRNCSAATPTSPGGQRQILPPLHVGFSSAIWSLRRPQKLEATKRHRHPVGHL
jgi:hypothetical protein